MRSTKYGKGTFPRSVVGVLFPRVSRETTNETVYFRARFLKIAIVERASKRVRETRALIPPVRKRVSKLALAIVRVNGVNRNSFNEATRLL